jgi:fructose-1,6-bisphosphatase/inositol monophosphatase family enzyme
MPHIDIQAVKNAIQEVAEAEILPFFRKLKPEHIAFKVGDDPVTIADKAAESALSTRLLDLLPGSKVVGEEVFATDKGVIDRFFGESPVWIIDPIDGTRNFVRGSPEFGVIVALAERNQIIAGWIYDPTSKEVFTAEKGGGAYYRGERLKVLPALPLPGMLGYLSDNLLADYEKAKKPGADEPAFERMVVGAHEYPRLVLNRPHFGKNKPQIHFRASKRQTFPWDDAAGVLIHAEAGGYAANWRNEPYHPAVLDRGLLTAPDEDSWHRLRDWFRGFSELPG